MNTVYGEYTNVCLRGQCWHKGLGQNGRAVSLRLLEPPAFLGAAFSVEEIVQDRNRQTREFLLGILSKKSAESSGSEVRKVGSQGKQGEEAWGVWLTWTIFPLPGQGERWCLCHSLLGFRSSHRSSPVAGYGTPVDALYIFSKSSLTSRGSIDQFVSLLR
ncbi:hypothetical protein BDV10DRAFT_72251 [Aspergillus recurvatus]